MIAHFRRSLIIVIAIFLFLVGLASVWTPFPIGAILMTFATFLFIANSRRGRAFVRRVRQRSGFVDKWMRWFEGRSSNRIVRVLKTTQPLSSRLRYR